MNTPLQSGKTPPNECPGYDTKHSESEVPVILGLRNAEHPFIAIAPRFTQARRSSTW